MMTSAFMTTLKAATSTNAAINAVRAARHGTFNAATTTSAIAGGRSGTTKPVPVVPRRRQREVTLDDDDRRDERFAPRGSSKHAAELDPRRPVAATRERGRGGNR